VVFWHIITAMFKNARKTSTDPAQEKLREAKSVLNKDISALIANTIHFKKLMNGAPNMFHKAKSSITLPIPADPATIIGSLANDFQEISQRANTIIQEQIEYSKTRRQKQPKQAPSSPGQLQSIEPNKPVDLAKQLSAWEIKYDLIAEASDPFSRFITKILTPQIGFGEGARIRRLRMTMLDNCVKTYKELKKLHREIVGSTSASIVNSHKIMTQVFHHWNAVNRLFSTFKMLKPEVIADTGGKISTPKDVKEDTAKPSETPINPVVEQGLLAIQDIKANANNFLGINGMQELISLASQFGRASSEDKIKLANDFLSAYRQVLTTICQDREIKLQNSMRDILAQDGPTTKEAQLARWLGKARHQILPGATSGPRLEVYKLIERIKQELNVTMNLLEKGLDEKAINTAIVDVNREIQSLKTVIRSLYFLEQPSKSADLGGSFF